MRSVPAAVQAAREAGQPLAERHLVWVRARDRSTGAQVADGFWTGREDRAIPVIDPATGGTVTRTYRAGGALLQVEPVTHATGLDIRGQRIELSPINAAVELQARGYDVRHAPVEVHRLWLHYDTREALAPASVWMVGTINGAPITTPEADGEARLLYEAVPLTRALTVGNPDLLSDEVQKRRSGDRFLRYVAGTRKREVLWGSK